MTLDDLRKIAEAATKGPWKKTQDPLTHPEGWEIEATDVYVVLECCGYTGSIARVEDAEFIETFNPQRVLEMIDTLRGAEIRLDHAKTVIDRLQARLAAVEKLHQPVEAVAATGATITVCWKCAGDLSHVFDGQVNYPCETIKVVRGE